MTVKRTSQVAAEVLGQATPSARASQVAAEVLGRGTPKLRCSQIVLEVMAPNTSSGGSPPARRRPAMVLS